ALGDLGWQPKAGDPVTPKDLIGKLGIERKHERLMTRVLEILGEQSFVEKDDTTWRVRSLSIDEEPDAFAVRLMTEFPALRAELSMLRRTGGNYARVLKGELSAIDVLFPEG